MANGKDYGCAVRDVKRGLSVVSAPETATQYKKTTSKTWPQPAKKVATKEQLTTYMVPSLNYIRF